MKKCCFLFLLVFFLTGCGVAETFETVADDFAQPVMAQMSEVTLELPDSAAAPVMNDEDGSKLYFCDGYVLTVQTLESGDMDRTARNLCGYSYDSLTVLETASDALERREWVWTAAGEGGEQIGRAAVLDDGSYHYCVTVMADAEAAGGLTEQWDALFGSFEIG